MIHVGGNGYIQISVLKSLHMTMEKKVKQALYSRRNTEVKANRHTWLKWISWIQTRVKRKKNVGVSREIE
jgi:hypothetical protein